MRSNPFTRRNIIGTGISAVLLLGATACSAQGEQDDMSPGEIARSHGMSVAEYIDNKYASKDCLENTPFDPVRTDSGDEATVSSILKSGILTADQWSVQLASAQNGKLIIFEVENNELAPVPGHLEHMRDDYGCEV